MRLKEDKSNYRASSLIRKIKPVPDQPLIHKSKKNTTKWCKGKVGIQHDYKLTSVLWVGTLYRDFNVCTRCNKREWIHASWPSYEI